MDAELINQIVRQVLANLNQIRPGSAPQDAAPAPAVSAPAPAAPPAVSQKAAANASPARTPAAAPGRKVFLTADMVRQRLIGAEGGALELEPFEFLTPNAEDYAADRHAQVRRKAATLPAPAPGPALTPGAAGAMPAAGPIKTAGFGLVSAKLGETAASAVRAAAQAGAKLEDWNRKGCWLRDSRTMCEAVLAGTLAGGVVIVPQAADAVLLTSRFRGIRPVQGTGPEAVRAALRHYAANVLVIGHACSSFHEIREMIRLFTAARPDREAGVYTDALWRHMTEVERS